MARVTYETALKCKQCGELTTSFDRYTSRVLCQRCGAHIMDFNSKKRSGEVTKNASIVTVKVTHKLFRDILEEV